MGLFNRAISFALFELLSLLLIQNNQQLVDRNAHGSEKVDSFAGDSKSYDIHTEECSGSITQKDLLIRKLKNDLEYSRKQQQETSRELRECELSIARLQGQVGKLQDEQSLKRSDVALKDRSLRILEQQHKDSRLKVRCITFYNLHTINDGLPFFTCWIWVSRNFKCIIHAKVRFNFAIQTQLCFSLGAQNLSSTYVVFLSLSEGGCKII